MIEELRRRLAHEAMGSPPVCRVRTLVPSSLAPAGSIMAVHRLSKVKPVQMVVTLDGKEWSLHPRRGGLPTVEILYLEPAGRPESAPTMRTRPAQSDSDFGQLLCEKGKSFILYFPFIYCTSLFLIVLTTLP